MELAKSYGLLDHFAVIIGLCCPETATRRTVNAGERGITANMSGFWLWVITRQISSVSCQKCRCQLLGWTIARGLSMFCLHKIYWLKWSQLRSPLPPFCCSTSIWSPDRSSGWTPIVLCTLENHDPRLHVTLRTNRAQHTAYILTSEVAIFYLSLLPWWR